jgi:hypothetical protein
MIIVVLVALLAQLAASAAARPSDYLHKTFGVSDLAPQSSDYWPLMLPGKKEGPHVVTYRGLQFDAARRSIEVVSVNSDTDEGVPVDANYDFNLVCWPDNPPEWLPGAPTVFDPFDPPLDRRGQSSVQLVYVEDGKRVPASYTRRVLGVRGDKGQSIYGNASCRLQVSIVFYHGLLFCFGLGCDV